MQKFTDRSLHGAIHFYGPGQVYAHVHKYGHMETGQDNSMGWIIYPDTDTDTYTDTDKNTGTWRHSLNLDFVSFIFIFYLIY